MPTNSASRHSRANRCGLLFLCLFVAAKVAIATATRPPNLVFILTDNQGAWSLGCYGNSDIRTPHIDRLAAEGVRFTRALSSNPVSERALRAL